MNFPIKMCFKKFFLLIHLVSVVSLINAQLTIYTDYNLQGNSGTCVSKTIYLGNNIPNGLNNRIKSISLAQGYIATLADSTDGTGERFTYMSSKSAININLSFHLQNKVSFIRVMRLPSFKVKKKGVCSTNNNEIDSIGNTTWFYDWNDKDVSTPTREYAPMAFMWYSTRDSFITKLINKDSITHYIAYNEPDVNGPSRMIVSQAIPPFKKMQSVGLRMGSPSASYIHWQDTFARAAREQKLKIDYVCVHWYDWGAYMTTHPDSIVSAAGILTRFKSFLAAVYDYYRKPIWITEFNANEHRTDSVHHEFMKIALPWLDSCSYVERYAYFFGNDVRSIHPNGSLTTAGKIYRDHESVDAYPENIVDTRPAFPISLASWQASAVLQGGLNQSTFAPTKIHSNLTAPLPITRGSGVVLPPTSSSNGYWGGTSFSTTTAEDGIADNKFLTFSLKSKNGKSVNYHSINKINIRIGSTGPIKYRIDYVVDNGRTFLADSISGPLRVTGNYTLDSIDLSTISNLQNVPPTSTVTFRIIPYDASGTGSFLIGSGVNDTLPDFEIIGGFSDANLVSAPLPTKLINFQLKRNSGNQINLHWSTSSEINCSHFELERSTNGLTFYPIATITGTNSTNGSTYNYIDKHQINQQTYYRLKVIDKDGNYVYSHVLIDVFSNSNTNIFVYPTVSANGLVKATFKKVVKNAHLMVVDVHGKLVSTYNLQAGATYQNVETFALQKGTYFLVLQQEGDMEVAKFIKL